jgi:hypothetical protein
VTVIALFWPVAMFLGLARMVDSDALGLVEVQVTENATSAICPAVTDTFLDWPPDTLQLPATPDRVTAWDPAEMLPTVWTPLAGMGWGVPPSIANW